MAIRSLIALCATAVLATGAVQTARAQEPDTRRAVYFTFSQPVAMPRVTLPAGRYLFQLVNSQTNRNIVQVSSADGARQYGMFMTIPVRRADLPNDPEIRFLETAANAPSAIGTYWFPGLRNGWEFVYPREQATRLAQSSKQPVLTTSQADASTAEQMQNAPLVRVTPTGEQVSVGDQPAEVAVAGSPTRGEFGSAPGGAAVAATQTAGGPSGVAVTSGNQSPSGAVGVTAGDAPRTAAATTPRTRLPQTASGLPFVIAIGAFLLAVGVLLGLGRRAGV